MRALVKIVLRSGEREVRVDDRDGHVRRRARRGGAEIGVGGLPEADDGAAGQQVGLSSSNAMCANFFTNWKLLLEG